METAARLGTKALARLLRPKSVAIVGASATPGALGASVLTNLERLRYSGEIHLINPKRQEIGTRPCLQSVEQMPAGVDVAVLAIPRAAVLETVTALERLAVGAAIIFSGGFAEGGEAGLAEQREISQIAERSGMVIEGPNCLGFVNHVDGVALTFVETPAVALEDRPGIAIVSQSGAMACVLGVMLTSRDLGLTYSISTGNEAASGVEDYVEYLLEDARTPVIGMIVEQFRQPQRFLALAAQARTQGVHIVLLHPGRSSAARASAATHTGALAGDYALMRVKVEGQGVMLVESLEELGDVCELALRCRPPPSGGTVLITESGAFKALALDLCEQIGLALPTFTDQDCPGLRAAIPDFVPVSNPLDLTAQALVDPDLYRRTLTALIGDARSGSVLLSIIQTDPTTCALKFPPIIAALKDLRRSRPVLFAGLDEGAEVPSQYLRELRALGVPYFPSADRPMRALARFGARRPSPPAGGITLEAAGSAAPLLPVPHAGGMIPEYRAKALLAPVGIPFPAGRFVHTPTEAQQAARDIGFPVVLKAQSAQLSHKSDAGGVVLGLADPADLETGWTTLQANLARHRPGLQLDGVLVEKMSAGGVEMIVGARNDPQWGAVMLVGFGGAQAEIQKDLRLLEPGTPVADILQELDLLKSAALLHGFRGSPALDVGALAELIARLGQWLTGQPWLRELDLNPVILYPVGRGVLALDALMQVGEAPITPSSDPPRAHRPGI